MRATCPQIDLVFCRHAPKQEGVRRNPKQESVRRNWPGHIKAPLTRCLLTTATHTMSEAVEPYYARVTLIVRNFNPKWKHKDCNHMFCKDGNQPMMVQLKFNGGRKQCDRLLDTPYTPKLYMFFEAAIKAFGYATVRSDDIAECYNAGDSLMHPPLDERWGYAEVPAYL